MKNKICKECEHLVNVLLLLREEKPVFIWSFSSGAEQNKAFHELSKVKQTNKLCKNCAVL